MQSLEDLFQIIRSDKQRLFIMITIIVISVVAVPVVVPHISQTNMLYHFLVHTFGLIIAIFLSAVSVFAYLRNRGKHLLLMASGFLLFVVIELLYLCYSTMGIQIIIVPILDIEVSHIILSAVLILFTASIIKTNRLY